MAYIPMIDPETGQIDQHLVKERALRRACREFGGPNAPLSYVNEAYEWCRERAMSERLQWRDERGLPRDEPTTKIDVSTWTDTFRRMT